MGASTLPAALKRWIRSLRRVHAQILHVARLFEDPERAGGGPGADEHRRRAAASDPTLMQEYLTSIGEQLHALRDEVEEYIVTRSPVAARPGTQEKLDAMRERVERGEGLFHDQDGR